MAYNKRAFSRYARQAAGDAARIATKWAARKAVQSVTQSRSSANPPKYAADAVYRGKFIKKRKNTYKKKKKMLRKKNKKKSMKIDLSYGGLAIKKEEYGTVDDLDTVYIINPAISDYELITLAVQSMIKKLLRKGINWHAPSAGEEIEFGLNSGSVNPVGLGFTLYGGNPIASGTDIKYQVLVNHPVVNGDTIRSVASAFYNYFYTYSAGYGLSDNKNTEEIYQFVMYSQVKAPTAVGAGDIVQTLATIDVASEVINYSGYSRLKVQNRTNSVSDSGSVEVNDSKPLEGYIYKFNGLPKTSVENAGDFMNMSISVHTKTFGAATTPGDFKEPPPMRVFKNCYARSKVYLDPGIIKEVTVRSRGSKNFLQFLKDIDYSGSTAGLVTSSRFPCQMLALEEVINSTDVNAVKLGFETGTSLMVEMVSRPKKIYSIPHYTVQNITETV
jgi:hypothetical protein